MKKLLLALAILISANAFAQRIKVSENDKFLKKYRIETSYVTVKGGLFKNLAVTLRSINETVFIKLDGNGVLSGGVQSDATMIFLLANDSTITVRSKGLQTTNRGSNGEYFRDFEYYSSINDLQVLKNVAVKSIRIYGFEGYNDLDISEGASDDLKKLAEVFLTEYEAKVLKKN